ncbi:PDR/VanB family oxidoreductase [Amycolatopsis pithecellobii]|uniref:2Fe-2S iron-sulfur cluster binding domain-containing protein n=1 Tax=Amycolatopsis pithecellobii TaxID=664692 RepID=A0A6N7Z1W9_9PSEU|nr:PDR/VanB family oxidoreductase [Amycolatopsis pithecellobii]MTD55493.1 2Fe-2S iron-sulfur cluster binding domain-containing protein [Amycolatopsis pithecellobii]
MTELDSLPGPGKLSVRVSAKLMETTGVCNLTLVPLEGERLPAFTAGSHIDLHLKSGLVRQYSLCNDPAESDRYELGVLRVERSRGGSTAVHDNVHEGDVVTISHPRNNFPLEENAPGRSHLVAGGIGITPLLSMAAQLTRHQSDFVVHYFCRGEEHAAFRRRLLESYPGKIRFHFDDESVSGRPDLEAAVTPYVPGDRLYICGPPGFLDAVVARAYGHRWPSDAVRFERFTAEPAAGSEGDEAFEIQLARSDRTLVVQADETVLEALENEGIEIDYSCESGVCGTCVTPVLDGVPDHRDSFLTPEQKERNDCFTPCCSRSVSATLVLDL